MTKNESTPSVLKLKEGAVLHLFGPQCGPLTQDQIDEQVSDWLLEKLTAEQIAEYFES